MKNNKLILGIVLILVFSLITIYKNDNEVQEQEVYEVQVDLIKASYSLPFFGVDINESLTSNTVVTSLDERFHFSFDYNISLSNSIGSAAYGGGLQPDIFWQNQTTETRIFGGLNVYLDEWDLGISNFDPSYLDDNTTQTFALELEIGLHILTIIAAEYQLPYPGAPLEEANMEWRKDQHVFSVVENPGDTIDPQPISDAYVQAVGASYVEDFTAIHERYEEPVLKFDSITTYLDHAMIHYDFNISTDETFYAVETPNGYDYLKVGDGDIRTWINDDTFSTLNLSLGKNYVYICGASARPNEVDLMYDLFYPQIAFDTLIIELTVEGAEVVYEEVTETTTLTDYTTVTETETTFTETITITETENNAEANYSYLMVPTCLIVLITTKTIIWKKKRRREQ